MIRAAFVKKVKTVKNSQSSWWILGFSSHCGLHNKTLPALIGILTPDCVVEKLWCVFMCVCVCELFTTCTLPRLRFFFSLPFLPDIFNPGSNGCVYKSRVHSQQSRSVLIVHTNTQIKTHTGSQTHDSHMFHPLTRQRVRRLERRLDELLNNSEKCKTIFTMSGLIFSFLSVVVFKLWINKPVRASGEDGGWRRESFLFISTQNWHHTSRNPPGHIRRKTWIKMRCLKDPAKLLHFQINCLSITKRNQ